MRPLHLRFRYLGLAFLGGAVGTGLRYGLTLLLPGAGQGRGALLAANVLGAFLLGLLLEGLAMRGPDQGIRRTGRILVGTGLLGGVTTFSTAMVEALTARREGKRVKFLMLWLVQVIGAVLAALAGTLCFVLLLGDDVAPIIPIDIFF